MQPPPLDLNLALTTRSDIRLGRRPKSIANVLIRPHVVGVQNLGKAKQDRAFVPAGYAVYIRW